jgi:hypothetical protein
MNLIEQETPLKPPFPDLPHWSENYCLAGHDPRTGVGFWLHLGRWRKDLEQWRETIIINLPDGNVIAHRSYGNALTREQGPGGSNYWIRILEKGRRLLYGFDGAARRVPASQLRTGLLVDGPQERLRFELTFTSSADIWDLHKVGKRQEFLGTGHIEQIGRIEGTIEIGSQSIVFSGKGNRDHSMGPRDTPTLKSHQWLQGYFENGLSFLVYDAVLRSQPKPVFCEAVVYEGDKLFDGRLDYEWRIDDADDAARNYGFSIEYEKGKLDIRTERISATAYLSFTVPNDIYIGVYPGGDPPLTLLEQSTLLSLDGQVKGFGNFERTVPGVIAIDP